MQCLQNLNIENYDLSKSFMEEGDGNKSVNSHLVPLHHTVNTIIAPLNTYQFYHLPTPHLRYLSDDKETAWGGKLLRLQHLESSLTIAANR
jgi:hypothetical protein